MSILDSYIDSQLAHGYAYFSKEMALKALGLNPKSFTDAATRLVKSQKLAMPRRGFYLILRPEDRVAGAPDPVRWIDPLMKYQNIDYRISLLKAAAFHGSSHQASMIFQVIAPKQLSSINIGRHQVQFIYQNPRIFCKLNMTDFRAQIKSDAGFAEVAPVELTLLDCIFYFHKAGGLNSVAQIVKDIGGKADARILATFALFYDNSAVRRLGYLLDYVGHKSQAKVLEKFAEKAKSMKLLDPSIKPINQILYTPNKKNSKWMLIINENIEVDF